MTRKATFRALTALLITTGASAFAQPIIDWFTIDGGGAMLTAGGGFELSGTIGQPVASSFAMPMTGGRVTFSA